MHDGQSNFCFFVCDPDRTTLYFPANCSVHVCKDNPLMQHASISNAKSSCGVADSANLMQTDDAQAVCVFGGGSKHIRHIDLLS